MQNSQSYLDLLFPVGGAPAVRNMPRTAERVTISGADLTIPQVILVSRQRAQVSLTDDPAVVKRVFASCQYVEHALATGELIYGVNTGFGGMANVHIASEQAADLQNNLLWFLKAGAGRRLPTADVRAAMLIRMNSHLHGVSGVRWEVLQRMETFLNAGVTPHVREFGSIGASGDLVPLASMTGALLGLDPRFMVDFNGEDVDCLTALQRLGLPRLQLRPKEGLAMVNGTAMMTGIAANCVADAQSLLAITLGAHALALQALSGTNQSFHPFVHTHKPHPGQTWVADTMTRLLTGSQTIRAEWDGHNQYQGHGLVQDRYSLRCLPQYLGPIADGFVQIARQIEVEMNSATDNPLIDAEHQASYHCGNFLGQYVGVAMDQLRYYLGLLAKHLDVQIALLVTPEFNNGLPASLVGNTTRKVNMGCKGLQLAGNSIMPLLTFFGNSLVDRFPTHAEQFNQNINSQGFGSSNLTRQAIATFHQYLAIALLCCVQAVDLRMYALAGHYDARAGLSPASARLYAAVRNVVGCPPSGTQPYIWNDHDQALDEHIAAVAADIACAGRIPQAVGSIVCMRDNQ